MGKKTSKIKGQGAIKDVDPNDVIELVQKVVKVIGDLLKKSKDK